MIATPLVKDCLLDSAREVFETMVFMALEEAGDEVPDIDEDLSLLGTITFKGAVEGVLGISCDLDCARTIAANMLGTDPDGDLSPDDINDAVGEVANMVMGSVKARVQDEIGTMDVSIPSVVKGRQLQSGLGEGTHNLGVTVYIEEEHVMKLSLLYRGGGDVNDN